MQPSDAVLQRRPSRSRIAFRIVVFALLGVLLLLCWVGWRQLRTRVNWTVQDIEQMVRTEVQADATRQEVEEWFARHGLKAQYLDGNETDSLGGKTVLEMAGLSKDEVASFARGDLPEAEVDLLRERHIFVYFFFDRGGKVIGHLVEPFDYMF
jgi:hypothetical protein